MWSFVGTKSNKQWIGLAMDVETREIVGAYIGVGGGSKCGSYIALNNQLKIFGTPSFLPSFLPWGLSSMCSLLH